MSKLMNIVAATIVCSLALAACNKKAADPAAPAAAAPTAAAPAVKVDGAAKPYAVGDKARCPVTGEEFTVTASTVQVEHAGKHYAFCCADCQPGFAKNPEKYTKN